MNTPTSPIIVFLCVADNAAKSTRICKMARHYFEQGQRILITASSNEAAQYIDLLLWRLPEEGFIPHVISDQSAEAAIVITTTQMNLNKASILLNLCPEVSPMYAQFAKVYELWDETHPDKRRLSEERRMAYQTRGHHVHLS